MFSRRPISSWRSESIGLSILRTGGIHERRFEAWVLSMMGANEVILEGIVDDIVLAKRTKKKGRISMIRGPIVVRLN